MTSDEIIVYCFPGQGSDKRIFELLKFDRPFKKLVIEYSTPPANTTLQEFAKDLVSQIDTNKKFVLLGHSLGGMICAELCEMLDPIATILISSAKNRSQLPFNYRFQKTIPLYKLVPGNLMLSGAKFLQPIVEPDRNKYRDIFKSMLAAKSALYMKRTVAMLIKWERTMNSKKIIQIHGDNDHTLPVKNVKDADYIVPGGSHMMSLTGAEEINKILKKILAGLRI